MDGGPATGEGGRCVGRTGGGGFVFVKSEGGRMGVFT